MGNYHNRKAITLVCPPLPYHPYLSKDARQALITEARDGGFRKLQQPPTSLSPAHSPKEDIEAQSQCQSSVVEFIFNEHFCTIESGI